MVVTFPVGVEPVVVVELEPGQPAVTVTVVVDAGPGGFEIVMVVTPPTLVVEVVGQEELGSPEGKHSGPVVVVVLAPGTEVVLVVIGFGVMLVVLVVTTCGEALASRGYIVSVSMSVANACMRKTDRMPGRTAGARGRQMSSRRIAW